ncbi:MAG: hypothetical protein ABIT09_06655 [Croceibacterium sp.]
MTKVQMTARDIFHATNVRAEPLQAGDKFEVTEAEAKELEDRGLARRSQTAPAAKAKARG